MKILLSFSDGSPELELDLEEDAVLAGRHPELDRIDGDGADDLPASARLVTITSPRVSSNHLLAWQEDETVCLRDLHSRNGSWLLLPRDATTRVASAEPLTLLLALSRSNDNTVAGPPDARWHGRSDFAEAVLVAVKQWLGALGLLPDRVRVWRSGALPRDARPDEPGRVPLADGSDLYFQPLETNDDASSQVLGELWRYVARQNQHFLAEEESRSEGMVIASPAMRRAHASAIEAGRRGIRSLLIMGESGSGKEKLAEVYHRHTGRSGPFVVLNCGALQKGLVRAELFGAEAGAFTGATHTIVGAVEQADGGTLFLDEIGELPLEIQPMLLRFLDDGYYDRIGASGKRRHSDARIVCATNRDLRAATRAGFFRSDLWFRLSVQVVELAPLRERQADLAAWIKGRYLDEARTVSLWDALTDEARALVRHHAWQGNFRELVNFAARLRATAVPGSVDAEECRRALSAGAIAALATQSPTPVAPSTEPQWSDLATLAARAFEEDRHHPPRTWNDQRELIENYLKPLAFYHLSGASGFAPPRDQEALLRLSHKVANRLEADRGTAAKQLQRYFERFAR